MTFIAFLHNIKQALQHCLKGTSTFLGGLKGPIPSRQVVLFFEVIKKESVIVTLYSERLYVGRFRPRGTKGCSKGIAPPPPLL
jgi:hypothetical protein